MHNGYNLEPVLLWDEWWVEIVPAIGIDSKLESIQPLGVDFQAMDNGLIIDSKINGPTIRIKKSTDVLQHNGSNPPWIFIFEHFELVVSVFDDV